MVVANDDKATSASRRNARRELRGEDVDDMVLSLESLL